MSPSPHLNHCERAELASAYALEVVPMSDVPAIQAHITSCSDCQREVESLRPAHILGIGIDSTYIYTLPKGLCRARKVPWSETRSE
jgi:hypothetical protein